MSSTTFDICERQARFASHEVALPLLPLDFLANLAHELGARESTHQSQYLRLAVGPEGNRRGALVHVIKVQYFDSLGRVTRVRPAAADATTTVTAQ